MSFLSPSLVVCECSTAANHAQVNVCHMRLCACGVCGNNSKTIKKQQCDVQLPQKPFFHCYALVLRYTSSVISAVIRIKTLCGCVSASKTCAVRGKSLTKSILIITISCQVRASCLVSFILLFFNYFFSFLTLPNDNNNNNRN